MRISRIRAAMVSDQGDQLLPGETASTNVLGADEEKTLRYQTIPGQSITSRSLGNQQVEVRLACKILNTMTSLGRPDSSRVACFPLAMLTISAQTLLRSLTLMGSPIEGILPETSLDQQIQSK